MQVREKVAKSQFTMVSQWFVAPKGWKVGLFGAMWLDERWKSARRCGAKHIGRSECTKHTKVGAPLEVDMSKKCMWLSCEADFQVNMLKTQKNTTCQYHSWRFRCGLCGRRKGFCPWPKVSKTWWFCSMSLHYTPLHSITLHYATVNYATLHYTKLHYTTTRRRIRTRTTTIHYVTLHHTTLHPTTFNYATLYTTLHYTSLQYTSFSYTALRYTTLHLLQLHHATLH